MGKRTTWSLGGALLALAAGNADARLVRIVVEAREPAPARPGAPAYEILHGRFHGELDPRDPHNRIITDLAAAPRNAKGRVEYSATFAIARPVDPARASGVLFYDVPNRGNGTVSADPDGHVRVISGWQGDIPPGAGIQTATVPFARGPAGRPLTGPVLARFTAVQAGSASVAITGGIGRPVPRPIPVSLDTMRARLVRQSTDTAPAIAIDGRDWTFADCRSKPFPGTPDPTQLCLRAGFDPLQAYTLVYEGRDPLVLGIGFAATRDLNAFLRREAKDDAGSANPVAGLIRDTVASGTSQSGNFLKSYVNLGFNADERGRTVFDGLNPNIAARQVPLNIRFGVPGGAANLYEPGSDGALWWARYDDRSRGRGVSSLLARCTASRTCPRIMETFGSAEFWGLRMSPGLVGTDARADLPLPAGVRRYYFPSVTHGGSYFGGFPLGGDRAFPGQPSCVLPGNPNPSTESMRVIHRALIAWVRGKTPPPSRYPTLATGDLVAPDAAAMGWPAIPGAPVPTGKINPFLRYDLGSGFNYADLSGVISAQPPAVLGVLPSLVPRVDADGNETSGIPSVQLLVPLGTYTGWNVQATGYGAGGGCGFFGGFIPFAVTRAERTARGDPRPSLTERYRDHAGFVARVRAVAAERIAAGWLLSEDAERLVAQADASDVLRGSAMPKAD